MKKPLTLRDLVIVLLSYWKPIFLCAVILAILGGSLAEALRENQDKRTISDAELSNLRTLYTQTKTFSENLEMLEEHLDQSIFMSLSPGSDGESALTFYVETDYQIMPELFYQNPDKREDIVSAFAQTYKSNSILAEDLKALLPGMALDNIYEMIRIRVAGVGIIEICSFHTDMTTAEAMTRLVFERMDQQIRENVADYTPRVISSRTSEITDGNIVETQMNHFNKVSELRKNTQTAQSDLFAAAGPFVALKADPDKNMQAIAQLLERGNAIDYIGDRFSLSGFIKNVILFGLAGLVCAYAAALLFYIMDMHIRYADDVIRQYRLSVLGVVPDERRNKKLFAKSIRKLQEVDLEGETAAAAYAVIGEHLRHLNPQGEMDVALVSSCGIEPVEMAKKALNGYCRVEAAGDILRDAAAAAVFAKADAVVLVEVRGRSNTAQIQILLQRIEASKKTIHGAIIQ